MLKQNSADFKSLTIPKLSNPRHTLLPLSVCGRSIFLINLACMIWLVVLCSDKTIFSIYSPNTEITVYDGLLLIDKMSAKISVYLEILV